MRAFAQEAAHEGVFEALNERNRDANMTTVNLNAAYFPASSSSARWRRSSSCSSAARRPSRATITVGVLVGFLAALNGFFDPIGQLSQVYTTYQSGMAALDKIFELLDEQPELTDAPTRASSRTSAARSPSTTCRSPTGPTTARSSRSTTST